MTKFRTENIQIDLKTVAQLQKQIDSYNIQVGVFNNVPRKRPDTGKNTRIGSYAEGPVRLGRKNDTSMSADVATELQQKYHWLDRPFRASSAQSKETIAFANYFLSAIAKGEKKPDTLRRIANLVQAIVRNPITRGEYGSNSQFWAKVKGFNRLMFDTGQFFKSIIARVK